MNPLQLHWTEEGQERTALWQADNGARLPSRVQTVTEMEADSAYRLASAGTGLLWRGDFQQARQLLQAMSHRMDAAAQRQKNPPPTTAEAGFAAHRKVQALRVRILGQLLVEKLAPINERFLTLRADRARQLVHLHEPLQRDQGLDTLAGAVRERDDVQVGVLGPDEALLAQRRHHGHGITGGHQVFAHEHGLTG